MVVEIHHCWGELVQWRRVLGLGVKFGWLGLIYVGNLEGQSAIVEGARMISHPTECRKCSGISLFTDYRPTARPPKLREGSKDSEISAVASIPQLVLFFAFTECSIKSAFCINLVT